MTLGYEKSGAFVKKLLIPMNRYGIVKCVWEESSGIMDYLHKGMPSCALCGGF